MALFKYPHVKDIWQAYLAHFVERYKGTKLERARDLFRQALSQVWFLWSLKKKLESDFGCQRSARSQMAGLEYCNRVNYGLEGLPGPLRGALQGHQAGACARSLPPGPLSGVRLLSPQP